jgi:hypothetical protein
MTDWDIDSPVNADSSGLEAAPGTSGPASPAPVSAPKSRSGRPAPPPAGAPQRKRRKPLPYLWLGIALLLLIAGLMGGFFVGRAQYSGDSAALADANASMGEMQKALKGSEDRNWTYYRTVEGLKAELAQATGSTPTTAPSSGGTRTSYSDGVYLVGEGIPAGTYDGVVNGTIGYWARLKATDGSISAIIENGIPKGPFVLTIATADMALELRGVTLTPH